VVGVRPGSSGGEFNSPAPVRPPPTGTALPPLTRATAPNAGVAPRSAAGGASVTRLVPGISSGGAPPSSGEDEEIPEPWKRGPRIDRMSSVIAPLYNKRGSPDSWYRRRCRSAIRTACVQRVSPGAPNVVPQSGGLPQEEGSNGRLGRSRDTRYGTRGPGGRADRNAMT